MSGCRILYNVVPSLVGPAQSGFMSGGGGTSTVGSHLEMGHVQ